MQDENGVYYYPDPSDRDTRVYVRAGAGGEEFRLWRAGHPEVWEGHDWLPYAVLAAAAAMYKESGKTSNPLLFYDINVARALLKEHARKAGKS